MMKLKGFWSLCLRTQITAIDVYDVSVSEAFCNIYVLYFSSLLLLAIISQVIIWFCLVSDCHCLTWGIDETMRVSMFQMMSKWRTPNSESMFSESDSMCINGCMFCSIDVMKCIQALAWFCFLRFLLSMQHIYLFVYFWVVGEFWVTWFFMPQFQIWRLAISSSIMKAMRAFFLSCINHLR